MYIYAVTIYIYMYDIYICIYIYIMLYIRNITSNTIQHIYIYNTYLTIYLGSTSKWGVIHPPRHPFYKLSDCVVNSGGRVPVPHGTQGLQFLKWRTFKNGLFIMEKTH